MKLSELDENNITDEIIRSVLFSEVKTNYDYADVMIIFGCHIKQLLDERLLKALNVLKSKRVSTIILSGGVGEKGDFDESVYMSSFLKENGVTNNIIVENKSKNSLENVINCIQILKEKDLIDKKILLVSNQFHIKKLSGMFKQINSGLDLIYDYPDESAFSYDVLISNSVYRNIAVEQVVKLKHLAIEGIIPDDEFTIGASLRNY